MGRIKQNQRNRDFPSSSLLSAEDFAVCLRAQRNGTAFYGDSLLPAEERGAPHGPSFTSVAAQSYKAHAASLQAAVKQFSCFLGSAELATSAVCSNLPAVPHTCDAIFVSDFEKSSHRVLRLAQLEESIILTASQMGLPASKTASLFLPGWTAEGVSKRSQALFAERSLPASQENLTCAEQSCRPALHCVMHNADCTA